MKHNPTSPGTLDTAYSRWLAAPHPRRPGRANAERGVTDLLNYQRGAALPGERRAG